VKSSSVSAFCQIAKPALLQEVPDSVGPSGRRGREQGMDGFLDGKIRKSTDWEAFHSHGGTPKMDGF
jgi:hypothetical protein